MGAYPYPIVGPIAPWTNAPIEAYNYQPSRFVISAIVFGTTTLITTSTNLNLVMGQQVRTLVPQTYGTRELTNIDSFVISVPSPNQVILNINSIGFTPFIANPSYGPTQAQIVAIGDNNSQILNTNGRIQSTFIPGSFINISEP